MKAHAPVPEHPYPWPWSIYLGGAAALWLGASQIAPLGQQGDSLATVGTITAAVLGTKLTHRGWQAYAFARRLKKARNAFGKVGKAQGRSRLATTQETKKAGMHNPGGLFLGAMEGSDLWHNGEGSAFIFAPPGTGKTVCSVIPQLLTTHQDRDRRPSSVFVLDLTGELYAVTARAMRGQGYEVFAVAPWHEQMSAELKIPITDTGFNPLNIQLGSGVREQCDQIARFLHPTPPNTSASSEYFIDFAQMILSFGLLVLVQRSDLSQLNLPALRRLLMSSTEELEKTLAEMTQCTDFNGAISQYANKLVSTKLDAPEEWSGAINTATKALRIYSDGTPLAGHVSTTAGFDFRNIKRGLKPKCVYLMIPPELVGTQSAWLNLVISTAIEQMGSDRTNKRVICLLDEFANAGYLPNLIKALGLYRKQGLQFAFYAQTMSQIKRLYGQEGVTDMLAMCECIQAFGIRDPETLKMLSELSGQTTIKDVSTNFRADLRGTTQTDYTATASSQSQPLLRPDDIRTMPEEKQLIFWKNLPPILADKVSYLNRRAWRKRADPNPYYRKD
jgi:type IV secretion system protein VirD4